jgi:hypothetical protein
VSGIPRNTLTPLRPILQGLAPVTRRGDRPLYRQNRQSLSLSPTVWAGFGAFAGAKDRASLLHGGLIEENPLMGPKPQLFKGNVFFSLRLLFVGFCDCINQFRELTKLDKIINDANCPD